MNRAWSPTDIMKKKFHTIQWDGQWQQAFSRPERSGVWIVWGNSGNGKTSFVMQLVAQLARHGRVFFNSLEEGVSLTLRDNLMRTDIIDVRRNVLIGCEDMDTMSQRLSRRKGPDFAIIDSIQYSRLTFPSYVKLKEAHPNKLLIFTSHAEGKQPAGRTAKSVKYDAGQKIWVEGFRAISNGRYNPGGTFTIWEQGAEEYWGIDHQKTPPPL